MLPGIRFLLAAIVLCFSILIFGLGAAGTPIPERHLSREGPGQGAGRAVRHHAPRLVCRSGQGFGPVRALDKKIMQHVNFSEGNPYIMSVAAGVQASHPMQVQNN